MNTSLHFSTTLSHLVEFRRFGSHPLSSQSRNQARTAISVLLIGLSRSSVRQRKLWRLSYFQPSTATCFHLQTNTDSDLRLSKIVRSTLPEATCRWLSNYLRGRQSVTSCRGVKSKARTVHTGAPQGSKMSPTLFSFYLADMPRPTEPVKRICYADDITVWSSGARDYGW